MSEQTESAQEQSGIKDNSRTLSIIAISLAALMVILIALVFWRMISFGRDAATAYSAHKSPTASAQPTETANTTEDTNKKPAMTLQEGREKLRTLADDSLCQGEADASFLIDFARISEESGQWLQDKSTVSTRLKELPEKCGETYASTLANRLHSASTPPGLAELVKGTFGTGTTGIAKRPAPGGAVDMGSFSDTSRNIQCAFDSGRLSCTINQYDYASDACQGAPVTYSVASDGTTSQTCSGGIAADNVVAYGTTVARDGLACTMTQEAVECWHEGSGKGFKLSRWGVSTF